MKKTKKQQGFLQVPNRYNLLQAKYFTKPLERKIFFAIALMLEKNITPQLEFDGTIAFEIPTAYLGRPTYNNLEDAFTSLRSIPIHYKKKDSEDALGYEFSQINFFKGFYYKRGIVKVEINREGYEFLTQFSQNDGYFWAHLKAGLSLSSLFAQHWYGLFSQYANFGELKNMTIEKIIDFHCIEDDKFIDKKTGKRKNSDLIVWTVYKPIEEINEKSNLFIELTPINNQRKPIIGFDFKITRKGNNETKLIVDGIPNYVSKLRSKEDGSGGAALVNLIEELATEYLLSDDCRLALIQENILNKVIYTHNLITEGKITIKKSKSLYMTKVIEEELEI